MVLLTLPVQSADRLRGGGLMAERWSSGEGATNVMADRRNTHA